MVAPLSPSSAASPKVQGLSSLVITHRGRNISGRLDEYHYRIHKHQGTLFDAVARLGSNNAARKEEIIKVVNGSPE